MRTPTKNLAAMTSLVVGVYACSSNDAPGATTAADAGADDVVKSSAPPLGYAEGAAYAPPPELTSLDAIAVDARTGTLYVTSGAKLLTASASAPGGALTVLADLAATGITTVSSMRVVQGGDLVLATSSQVARVTSQGAIVSAATLANPFGGGGGGFGGPAVAISPDGASLYAVESGSGSASAGGGTAAHVARFDLRATPSPSDGGALPAPTLSSAETWELTAPFEIVPATTSAIDADAPVVSLDNGLLYVAHVVLRTLYAVDVHAPHAVTAVDTDSLQRSATSTSLDENGLLVQAAVFDQTVPVFRLKSALVATLLTEIPTGTSPQAVASFQKRVFVVMGAGLGGAVRPPGDGGFNFGDGGFPFGDGGFGGFGGGDAAPTPPRVRVFEVQE